MNDLITDIATAVLTPEAHTEFSIVSVVTESPEEVRFRLDPGVAFEREGLITRGPDGSVRLTISQRYRPDEYPSPIASAPLTGPFPGDLQSSVTHANWRERRPHWRETFRRDPNWTRVKTATTPSTIREGMRTVTEAAREENIAHFLWRAGEGKLAYGNNPPRSGVVFSVNPRGEWSFHAGPVTRPLDTPPDLSALTAERAEHAWAVRLPAQDLGTGTAAAIRSVDQGVKAPDQPAPRPPGAPEMRTTQRRGRRL